MSDRGAADPEQWSSYRNFARCVMSDVYALLDYLSGRAKPSLGQPVVDTAHLQNRSIAIGSASDSAGDYSYEVIPPLPATIGQSVLLSQAMRIGEELDGHKGTIKAADMALLIRVRDQLNGQAAPATGSSISFTFRVVDRMLGRRSKDGGEPYGIRYIIPDKSLDDAALRLATFVRFRLHYLFTVLIAAVILSTYVAWGKLLLDTRDAVNRDFGSNLAAITAEASLLSSVTSRDVNYTSSAVNVADTSEYDTAPFVAERGKASKDVFVDNFCVEFGGKSVSIDQSCNQREQLLNRRQNIHELLARWILPARWVQAVSIKSDEQVAQFAATLTGILGNYVLPVLYGWLGALGYVLRRLNRQLADYLLTPRDVRANHIRIMLGTVTGACIGLFVNSSAGAATLSGLGGAAVTLSASGLAFLAGYGVEGVFKMIDSFIEHLFGTAGQHRA